MKTDRISEGFFYLQVDPRLDNVEFVLRPASGPTGRDVLIGMDSGGRRHLLVRRAFSASVFEDVLTANLSLSATDHEGVAYIDLACKNPALGMVFERLCADVISRLQAQRELSPERALMVALDDWKALFRAAPHGLSREDEIGLHGELALLERFARLDPVKCLGVWTGPAKSLRDFTSSSGYLEVKTTTSQDAKLIHVSTLDQLDPAAGSPLYLAAVRIQNDPQGDTILDVFQRLVGLGVPSFALERKLVEYGYEFSSAQNEAVYRLVEIRAWSIDDGSPGLRRSELGKERLNGIERVQYSLSVDTLGPEISETEFEELIHLCLE